MKITVLMENSAQAGLVSEHGLSFYMKYQNGRTCWMPESAAQWYTMPPHRRSGI